MSLALKYDLLFTSWEADELVQLKKLLDRVPDRDIRPVRESHLVKGDVVTPYILTSRGVRIVGIDAIDDYLANGSETD